MDKSLKQFTIGVDIGGTNIKFGLVNAAGKVIDRSHLKTKTFISDKKKLIKAVVEKIKDLIEDNGLQERYIQGIGVGLPGLINFPKGVVDFLPNIPGWRNVPFKKLVEQELRIPTFIDNDVNVITLGEWKFGAGRGYKNLICMTIGTGIGGGLVLDNELYRGEGFVAGEIGHIPLNEEGRPCTCGGWGCFETFVGNKRLLQEARAIFKKKDIRLQDIYSKANAGENQAVEFWEKAGRHIGNALVGVVNLLNPRLIIIGGGVSNNYKFFHKVVVNTIAHRAMKVQARMVKVVRAKLGDDAGLFGAHVLVKGSILGR